MRRRTFLLAALWLGACIESPQPEGFLATGGLEMTADGQVVLAEDVVRVAGCAAGQVVSLDGTAGGVCNTDGAGPRETGMAGSIPGDGSACVSRWGAEDMVGNLWEWTGTWLVGGKTWQTIDGQNPASPPWPAGYGDGADQTWSVTGRSYDGTSYADGLPAAAMRGGHWSYGPAAGVFSLRLDRGPTFWSPGDGFRCARRG